MQCPQGSIENIDLLKNENYDFSKFSDEKIKEKYEKISAKDNIVEIANISIEALKRSLKTDFNNLDYEILFNLTNDTYWLNRLERLAYNGLAATISDDMWSHQYDQQVNQLNCSVHNKKSFFRTNSVEANVFGLEPHFGCCTANFGQGWPLFALSAYSYYKDSVHLTGQGHLELVKFIYKN